ncbi:MAG: hypothetical protein ABSE27_07040 [Acidobacteriaceae bacterium]|jgi:hypothetical protein
MAIFRATDEDDNTVQMLYKGLPLTPKMKKDDPHALLEGLSQALEVAYQKIRDAGID